jgi:hypothetical protein
LNEVLDLDETAYVQYLKGILNRPGYRGGPLG